MAKKTTKKASSRFDKYTQEQLKNPKVKAAYDKEKAAFQKEVAAAIPTVTVVDGDDWQGFFIDGKLIDEGHSLRIWSILESLASRGLITYQPLEADQDTLEQFGRFAEALEQNRKDGIIQ